MTQVIIDVSFPFMNFQSRDKDSQFNFKSSCAIKFTCSLCSINSEINRINFLRQFSCKPTKGKFYLCEKTFDAVAYKSFFLEFLACESLESLRVLMKTRKPKYSQEQCFTMFETVGYSLKMNTDEFKKQNFWNDLCLSSVAWKITISILLKNNGLISFEK
jgi:hypothetical protein